MGRSLWCCRVFLLCWLWLVGVGLWVLVGVGLGGFVGMFVCILFGLCLGLFFRFLFFCFGGGLVGFGMRWIGIGRCIF